MRVSVLIQSKSGVAALKMSRLEPGPDLLGIHGGMEDSVLSSGFV